MATPRPVPLTRHVSTVRAICRELCAAPELVRKPEPDLVMATDENVAAFLHAGRPDGVMAGAYLFGTSHMSDVIKPGDTVVDLGCGPATQLIALARHHPQATFIGLDMSEAMLLRAGEQIAQAGATNVSVRREDMTTLATFAPHSVDAIVSSMALHHLPDESALEKSFAAIARVLRPGGGLCLLDFGLVKTAHSVEFLVALNQATEHPLLLADYRYSLLAAFSKATFAGAAARHLGSQAQVHATFPMPVMVLVKSKSRRGHAEQATVHAAYRTLTPHQRADFNALRMMLRLGGLKTRI